MSDALKKYLDEKLEHYEIHDLMRMLKKTILADPLLASEWDAMRREDMEADGQHELSHCIAYPKDTTTVETENVAGRSKQPGGNCMVDFITLPSGNCIAISEDGAGVYVTRDDFYNDGDCLVWLEWRYP